MENPDDKAEQRSREQIVNALQKIVSELSSMKAEIVTLRHAVNEGVNKVVAASRS